MMECLALTLPFPPSINHYWRHVFIGGHVRTLISADGRKYADTVGDEVTRQGAPQGIAAPLVMHITLHAPDKRRRDVDNYCKALLDALVKAGVIKDDCQVRDLRIVWGDTLPGGKAVVMIRELPASQIALSLSLDMSSSGGAV